MSYTDPQLNVRSDAALYQQFFTNISDSFAKTVAAYSEKKKELAEIAKKNKEDNEKIEKDVETYKSSVEADIVKADSANQIDLVESYQGVLDKLAENKELLLSGNLTEEKKIEIKAYERKANQSIQLAKNGLNAFVIKGSDLVESQKNGSFDKELNDPGAVYAMQISGKGAINKVIVDVENPMDVRWNVYEASSKDNPESKGEEVYSFDFNSLVNTEQNPTADFWVTTPDLTYPGVDQILTDKNNAFLEGVPTKEAPPVLVKKTDKKNTYQINEVLDIEAIKQDPSSALMLQLRADADAYLAVPSEAISLYNNSLVNLSKDGKKWYGLLEGKPLTPEQKIQFEEAYIESFLQGQANSYSVKKGTVEEDIPQEKEPVKPGKEASALIAKLDSLKGGQVGSFITHKNKTVKQTGDNEWTLTEEVVDRNGNTSTKVISKVDDPQELKEEFGIIDAALVAKEAKVDIDLAVDNAIGQETPNEEQ